MAGLTAGKIGTWFRHAQRALLCAIVLPQLAAAHSPADALKQFKVADGLEISLFAAEPDIRQPVAINYDERGRLWVVQYLQYPNPAGLKKVRVDQFLRTVFDRVPEPPPHGPKGADRITICEDTDGDGRADKYKDFCCGLNMATGVAIGYGGVFVAQSPYLLFYPDRNRDDVPDGDPEVCVAGFGMEDSHAYPNSLQIGPDGWLYGAQGSNVWAKVKVELGANGQTYAVTGQNRKSETGNRKTGGASSPISDLRSPHSTLEFNQCVWRYHPPTRRFEIFAEGGGNTWGVDFDRNGQIIAGTNFGGVCGLHMVQGGYYVKGFAKHGPLSNPHAYGYFEHMPYASPARISQGEHVMCGGIVYQGGELGPEIENQYVTCALLHRAIYWHKLIPDRSTFKSDFGGTLVSSTDPEFRPVDLALAPDGAIMISDWCDVRANHVLPEDDWNKTNGRIWRLAAKGAKPSPGPDLAKQSSDHLVELLSHKNAWYRRESRRVLAERGERDGILDKLDPLLLRGPDSELALEALWTLDRLGLLGQRSMRLLRHSNPHVRAWTVRLVADHGLSSGDLTWFPLERLARDDTHPRVRSQLASSAQRLPAFERLRIVDVMLSRNEDSADPHIPLLLWWAVEPGLPHRTDVKFCLLGDAVAWQRPLMRTHMLPRIARRCAAAGNEVGFARCAELLNWAPTIEIEDLLIAAMSEGLEGKRLASVPKQLEESLARLWKKRPPSATLIRFALQLGSEPGYQAAMRLVAGGRMAMADRVRIIELLGQAGRREAMPLFIKLLRDPNPESLRMKALAGLAQFDDEIVGKELTSLAPTLSPALRTHVLSLLVSRKGWSSTLLQAVADDKIAAREITADLAQTIHQHGSAELDRLIEKHVGKFQAQTSLEKQAQMTRIAAILAKGQGDRSPGKELAAKHCGTCHTLFGEGGKIGPDLTTADRANRDLMLTGIVDPSLAIRQEYAASTILTDDGQVLTGIVVESTPASVTLVDAKNQKTTVARSRIDQLKPADQSLMPEKILDPLSEVELRDLFAHLETGVKVVARPSQLASSFDRDAEDWVLEDNGPVTKPEHQSTGGIPGGFVLVRDASGDDVRAIAPQKFLGDLSRFADGNAWFDARRVDESDDGKPHPIFGTLSITGGGRTLKQDLFHPTVRAPNRQWTRFSGRITAEAFGTDEATFKSVLANVTRMTVTLEAIADVRETIAFDNFALQAIK